MTDEEVKIVIPMRTPTLNDTLEMHWAARSRDKKMWKEWMVIGGPRGIKKRFARIVKVLCIRRRLLDKDNFKGGCKAIIDNLKDIGWIEDDRPGKVEVFYYQEAGHPDRTEIVLSEFDGEKDESKNKKG